MILHCNGTEGFRPGLQNREYGNVPFMTMARHTVLQGSHPKEIEPQYSTALSEPGFDQTPEATDQLAIESMVGHGSGRMTFAPVFHSAWEDGSLCLRKPGKLGPGASVIMTTPAEGQVSEGGAGRLRVQTWHACSFGQTR